MKSKLEIMVEGVYDACVADYERKQQSIPKIPYIMGIDVRPFYKLFAYYRVTQEYRTPEEFVNTIMQRIDQ